jgi:RND family efflux transporter MFP subunit
LLRNIRNNAHFFVKIGYNVPTVNCDICGAIKCKYHIEQNNNNMKLRSILRFVLAVNCIVAVSCSSETANEQKTDVNVKVKVMKVEASAVGVGQSFSGTVEESSGSSLSFAASGTIKSIAVSSGQRVSKGQLIATLDDVTYRNALQAAAATLEQANDAYDRLKLLHENGSLPDIQWVEVQSKLKQAQSSYEISQKSLADTKLYAPFSGYISEKNVEVGQNVMPGLSVVKLVNIENVKVTISVPETEISNVTKGSTVEIEVPALDNQTFTGRIDEKGVVANSLSRSYEVKAVVANHNGVLLPGMICNLLLQSDKVNDNAIVLPCNIIQLDSSNHNFVWAAVNGKAVRKNVELGKFIDDKVVISSGVSVGDEIIIEGQQKVSDGMQITVIK